MTSLSRDPGFDTPAISPSLSVEASRLLHATAADPWGLVSPSVYETAQLVVDAPWLSGHTERVRFLCDRQHTDGTWGGLDGYALVPTLGATRALLTCLDRPPGHAAAVDSAQALHTAEGGLDAVSRLLRTEGIAHLPDTVAVELVVPALVLEIGALLDRLSTGQYSRLRRWCDAIALPPGLGIEPLQALRASAAEGHPIPRKFWHAWETLGLTSTAAFYVQPVGGAIGGSPAATVAWLGDPPPPSNPSTQYLDRLQQRAGGPVPSITPITYFERAWLLCAFATSRLPCEVPGVLLDSLEDGLTEHGAPAGPGLPPDADDTAAVLLALAAYGRPYRPDALMDFRTDGYFQCFIGERTPSNTANAHVLETLAHHTARRPADRTRYVSAMSVTADWLLDMQQPDGSWEDKWHASSYYATACCTLALTVHGTPTAHAAAQRAVAWVLSTQRTDGGWGRWHSTVEETSYALQILSRSPSAPTRAAADRGLAALRASTASLHQHMPLWHDKDLYAPVRVIHAARLAAVHLSSQSWTLTKAARAVQP